MMRDFPAALAEATRDPWRSADVFSDLGNHVLELHRHAHVLTIRTPNGRASFGPDMLRQIARLLDKAAGEIEAEAP